jgi:hypothetical protein
MLAYASWQKLQHVSCELVARCESVNLPIFCIVGMWGCFRVAHRSSLVPSFTSTFPLGTVCPIAVLLHLGPDDYPSVDQFAGKCPPWGKGNFEVARPGSFVLLAGEVFKARAVVILI